MKSKNLSRKQKHKQNMVFAGMLTLILLITQVPTLYIGLNNIALTDYTSWRGTHLASVLTIFLPITLVIMGVFLFYLYKYLTTKERS